jgi:hypothetical protein
VACCEAPTAARVEASRRDSRGTEGGTVTEDELLDALLDTLLIRRAIGRDTVAQHVRRSDRAIVQGVAGMPDILGVVGRTLIAWELKTATGLLAQDQWEWQTRLEGVDAVDVRVIRPADLDQLVDEILKGVLVGRPVRTIRAVR